jgi:hypothetical protein
MLLLLLLPANAVCCIGDLQLLLLLLLFRICFVRPHSARAAALNAAAAAALNAAAAAVA